MEVSVTCGLGGPNRQADGGDSDMGDRMMDRGSPEYGARTDLLLLSCVL